MALEVSPRSRLSAFLKSDIFYRFRTSYVTVLASAVTVFILLAALLAPWIAPHDPFDVSTLSLWDSELPPVWADCWAACSAVLLAHGSAQSEGAGIWPSWVPWQAVLWIGATAISHQRVQRCENTDTT